MRFSVMLPAVTSYYTPASHDNSFLNPDIHGWIRQYVTGKWSWDERWHQDTRWVLMFRFANEHDAMLFKLTWGGSLDVQ